MQGPVWKSRAQLIRDGLMTQDFRTYSNNAQACGPLAEFVVEELGCTLQEFDGAMPSGWFRLDNEQSRQDLIPWEDGQDLIYLQVIEGGWDVAEVLSEEEEPECRHLSWDWTLRTCVDCGEQVDMPEIPEPTGGCMADRWGTGAHRYLGNYCIACGFRRTL